MANDDDLRFGDVSGGDNGNSEFEAAPLAVAGIVILILLIGQPLSGDMGGLDMNIIGVLVVGTGGVLAAFGL